MINILVMSSTKTSHLLKGFFHQWVKHWQPVWGQGTRRTVVTQGAVDTPAGWLQYRAAPDSLTRNWAGHLYDAIEAIADEDYGAYPVLLLMDDYWLCESTKPEAIAHAYNQIGRWDKVDLSGDRFGFLHEDYDEHFIKSSPTADYLSSTQAALWCAPVLASLAYCNVTWNPWQFELEGSKVLQEREKPVRILGAKSRPIQYANVSLRGQKRLRLDRLSSEDKRELLMVGAISKEDFFDEG